MNGGLRLAEALQQAAHRIAGQHYRPKRRRPIPPPRSFPDGVRQLCDQLNQQKEN